MELLYKRATMEDLALLMETRIEVLRAANRLSDEADLSEVKEQSFHYYKKALGLGTCGSRRHQLLSGDAHLSQSQREQGIYHEYVYSSPLQEKRDRL